MRRQISRREKYFSRRENLFSRREKLTLERERSVEIPEKGMTGVLIAEDGFVGGDTPVDA